ncbi:MAG: hypothetical protein ACAI44_13840 [Candidatus Sericytochromatia bacterium]
MIDDEQIVKPIISLRRQAEAKARIQSQLPDDLPLDPTPGSAFAPAAGAEAIGSDKPVQASVADSQTKASPMPDIVKSLSSMARQAQVDHKLKTEARKQAHLRLEQARKLVEKAVSGSSRMPLRPLIARAVELYSEAISLCPTLSEPYLAIASLSVNAKLFREAATVLHHGLQELPGDYQLTGMLDSVQAQYQQYLIQQQVQAASRRALERRQRKPILG